MRGVDWASNSWRGQRWPISSAKELYLCTSRCRQPAELPCGEWLGSRHALALRAAGGWLSPPLSLRPVGWILKPTGVPFTDAFRSLVAIAPDGSAVVYTAGGRLYRRALNQLDTYPIRGTDGAPLAPFFSPDGQTLGCWETAAGALRRLAPERAPQA